MLLQPLIHPPLLRALAGAGHGSQVLIADGNYPVTTAVNPHAEVVYLNLQAGLLDSLTVLHAVQTVLPIEAAAVMEPGGGGDPAIFLEFENALPGLRLQRLERHRFYATARSTDTAACIATGEIKHFGNLLITVGTAPMGGSQ